MNFNNFLKKSDRDLLICVCARYQAKISGKIDYERYSYEQLDKLSLALQRAWEAIDDNT